MRPCQSLFLSHTLSVSLALSLALSLSLKTYFHFNKFVNDYEKIIEELEDTYHE